MQLPEFPPPLIPQTFHVDADYEKPALNVHEHFVGLLQKEISDIYLSSHTCVFPVLSQ